MEAKHEFVDRYDALGIARPGPETVCKGQCEGTGIVPTQQDDDEPYATLWAEGHKRSCSTRGILSDLVRARSVTPRGTSDYVKWLVRRLFSRNRCDDGWHFVKCPDCKGTGKQWKNVMKS